jgi:DNA-binding transcriptional MocR family regulator
MKITLDATSHTPLVEQIVMGLAELIRCGQVTAGTRMPSVRVFARTHTISTFTVVEAYGRLTALGHLAARQGAGHFVRAPLETHRPTPPDAQFERAQDHMWQIRSQLEPSDRLMAISTGRSPEDWEDASLVRNALRSVASRSSLSLTRYGEPRGYRPLLTYVQSRLHDRGIHANENQILMTLGASQAYDLLIKLLISPECRVMVDDPGYSNLFSLLKVNRTEILGVPRTEDGPDLAVLEHLARTKQPKVFFTQTVAHNPTGCGYGARRAFEVLRLADTYNFHIVEVDAFAEFYPEGRQRLAEIDQLNRVIHVSTFSKAVSPAMRVGYVTAAAPLISELEHLKIISTLSASPLNELVIYEVLTSTAYRRHIDQYRRKLEQGLIRAQDLALTNGFQVFGRPDGGKFIWLRHPDIEDSALLAERARAHGLLLAPGYTFRPNLESTPWFRINTAYADHPTVVRSFSAIRR